MRAGRLLQLVLILQDGRRHTAQQLAEELQVSGRTVLRDLDALSAASVPVYATRGPGGGFQLLDTFRRAVPTAALGLRASRGRLRRVRVRLAPAALQLALVEGAPEGWRPRSGVAPPADRPDWVEGSFRYDTDEALVRDLLSLGPEVEVLLPVEIRQAMATIGRRIARLHRPTRESATASGQGGGQPHAALHDVRSNR